METKFVFLFANKEDRKSIATRQLQEFEEDRRRKGTNIPCKTAPLDTKFTRRGVPPMQSVTATQCCFSTRRLARHTSPVIPFAQCSHPYWIPYSHNHVHFEERHHRRCESRGTGEKKERTLRNVNKKWSVSGAPRNAGTNLNKTRQCHLSGVCIVRNKENHTKPKQHVVRSGRHHGLARKA